MVKWGVHVGRCACRLLRYDGRFDELYGWPEMFSKRGGLVGGRMTG